MIAAPAQAKTKFAAYEGPNAVQTGEGGTALFMWLAGQLVAVSQEVESGALSDDQAKPIIARLCVDVAGRIMGTGNTHG